MRLSFVLGGLKTVTSDTNEREDLVSGPVKGEMLPDTKKRLLMLSGWTICKYVGASSYRYFRSSWTNHYTSYGPMNFCNML